MNKYDSFRVNDSSSPLDVKYISFASYNSAPMEFYYNCSKFDQNRQQHSKNINQTMQENSLRPENFAFIPEFENISEPIVKTIYTEHFSAIELGILVVSMISLSINTILLYCMYSFSRIIND